MFFGIVSWRGINMEDFVLRECNLPFWIRVKLSNTLKTQMKQDKQSLCARPRREKNGAKPIIFYMVSLIIVNIIFS